MFSRRPGVRFNRGRVSPGIAASPVVQTDLRLLSSASKLYAYNDTILGPPTLSPTMLLTGTSPAATLSGNLAGRGIKLKCTTGGTIGSGAMFKWSNNDGGTWSSATAMSTSPTDIGGGTSVAWFAGTAVLDDYWQAVIALWPGLATAGCDWTDGLIRGPIYKPNYWVCKDGVFRDVVYFDGASGLSNESNIPNPFRGLNTPWEVWIVGQLWKRYTTSTDTCCLWSTSHQTTTRDLIHAPYSGPSVTGGAAAQNRWRASRRDTVPNTDVNANSTVKTDLGGHAIRYKFDASTLRIEIDGVPVTGTSPLFSVPFSSAAQTLPNRAGLGFAKFGTLAASNHAKYSLLTYASYNAVLSDQEAADVWRAVA